MARENQLYLIKPALDCIHTIQSMIRLRGNTAKGCNLITRWSERYTSDHISQLRICISESVIIIPYPACSIIALYPELNQWSIVFCFLLDLLAPTLLRRDADPNTDHRRYRNIIIHQIFATCSTFYVPLLIILILYWKIYQTARKRIHRRRPKQVLTANNNQVHSIYTVQSHTQRCILSKTQRVSIPSPLLGAQVVSGQNGRVARQPLILRALQGALLSAFDCVGLRIEVTIT